MTWSIDYLREMETWIDDYDPPDEKIDLVSLWVVTVEIQGPTDGCTHVTGDLYTYTIRDARVRADFLAITHDRKVMVKGFLPTDDAP